MRTWGKQRTCKRGAVLVLMLSLLGATPSYAEEVEHYDWYREVALEKGYSLQEYDLTNGWNDDLQAAFNEWHDKCAPYSSYYRMYGWYINAPNLSLMGDYDMQMRMAISESSEIEYWLKENVHYIVPEGTGVEEALKLVYEYIQNKGVYEHAGFYSSKAITLIESGKASCNAYSSLYRDIINYLRFDENWKACGEEVGPGARKLDMQVVCGTSINYSGETGGHAWNCLTWIDGTERYFDLTWDNDRSDILYESKQHSFDYYMKLEEEFYEDGRHLEEYRW